MKNLLLPLLMLAMLSACKDEPEQIPAYLDLQAFSVAAPGGASWQKVTDGWLYVNGEFLGAYSLPSTIPVLVEGESEVILFPGVKENGIAATPNIYPYLKKFTSNYTLTAGQTTTVKPATDYDPDAVFALGSGRGDFDGGSFIGLENRDTDTTINFTLTPEGAFAGECLLMQIDTAHPVMDIATEKIDKLPITGAPEVWLEMHYQADVPFFLYLLSGQSEKSLKIYQFNTSAEWNKIYFNLTEPIVTSAEELQRLYFRLSLPKDNNGSYSQLRGTVRVDNIRIVHY